MIQVKALDTYEKLEVKDKELNLIPKKGRKFKVSEERLEVLLGKNKYSKAFVEVVERKENEKQ